MSYFCIIHKYRNSDNLIFRTENQKTVSSNKSYLCQDQDSSDFVMKPQSNQSNDDSLDNSSTNAAYCEIDEDS